MAVTTRKFAHRLGERGYALVLVMLFTALSVMILGVTLGWTMNSSRLTERNNQYFRNSAAAEAATEAVLANMAADYVNSGEGTVFRNLDQYGKIVPDKKDAALWKNFEFNDGAGQKNRTYVDRVVAWGYVELNSIYRGLRGMASTYRIVSNARELSVRFDVPAGVKQEVQVASIPIYQFAIFYMVDLEINPGATMKITGRVHSNRDIYVSPNGVGLAFNSDVTSAGKIIHAKKTNDPVSRIPGTITYLAQHDSGVSALTLPIGTNNSPDAIHALLDVPPSAEKRTSAMGQQRFYNKADIVVLVYDSNTVVSSGAFNNFSVTIPWIQAQSFLSTNVQFTDKREGKIIKATQLDVGGLNGWSKTNSILRNLLLRDVSCIYVADLRAQSTNTEPAVRIVDGQTLPSLGLTVATPNPLYVLGNYNAPGAALGTLNTQLTKPASLAADAITILSTNWKDSASSSSLAFRVAADTTVNAAFLGGTTETTGGFYSGGVENFPRFMEDWTGKTLTYSGSMVAMFNSKMAKAPWGTDDVYVPPMRNWAFDVNFLDATKLPPATPQLLRIVRGSWDMLAPNSMTGFIQGPGE